VSRTLIGEHHATHDLIRASDKQGCGFGSICASAFHLAACVAEH
jgi:hypothetical protein